MDLFFAVAFVLISLIFFWQASRQRQKAGLPGGTVIYTDTKGWFAIDEPLYDPVYDLTGKPDYLIKHKNQVIPVEVKTGRTPHAPFDSHIFQLAAYCYLVDRTMGRRPPYGIIKYPNRNFSIPYTAQLEKELIELLAEIRNHQRFRSVDRSHDNPGRCAGCGFQKICDQQLGYN